MKRKNSTAIERAILENARHYARAVGRDPATIRTVKEAEIYMDRIASDCKLWGSD